jgi:GNAT superfamily N-acetyltransferase
MFWKGKLSLYNQLSSFFKKSDLSLLTLDEPVVSKNLSPGGCTISVSKIHDVDGIAKLLNEFFEEPESKSKASVTGKWVRSTYLDNHAIWIVAKDSAGTIRGCVSSFRCVAPYPNAISGCGKMYPWGIVDWFCVHPLWRSKGLGSALLETLDLVTYRLGRNAHVFIKEGLPLPFPHVPIYVTWLRCRRAGSSKIKQMADDTGLSIHPYKEVERDTGLPLVRVEGVTSTAELQQWENALDNSLPECWVFLSGSYLIDDKRGWQTDSLISMYAFRWSPGKWLASKPNSALL